MTTSRAVCSIERQLEPGVELVVAGHGDPQIGPIITVGAGGTLVEVLRDACLAAGAGR